MTDTPTFAPGASPDSASPFERFRHIVVEGPIGAGKTSLARKLAERFGAQPVLEEPAGNPFLERFYRDSRRYALPTQLFFLFQRVNQLRDLAQHDLFSQAMVGDFLLDKDPLFARLTLDDDELKLYQQIFDSLSPQAPTPDLVIYLQAQPDTLVERVQRRGIAMEAGLSEPYLRALADTYSRFFYHYDEAPLLIVNTEHLNPIERDEDFAMLLRQVTELRGRRSFFSIGE
ncbi:deoxynucleoside kinase [Burkholderiaceae bacterium FT117]|uniref:deoxynucleoside kinase n=1 Tax=Zeimonas sediminis TaxID=2944268 RepID=UPI002342F0F7|nr:deoxynucleoside kinase [Zeimonas sediminis]MCM5570559.1 deoxynucleoside kinase [Zeimonas sediminis]